MPRTSLELGARDVAERIAIFRPLQLKPEAGSRSAARANRRFDRLVDTL